MALYGQVLELYGPREEQDLLDEELGERQMRIYLLHETPSRSGDRAASKYPFGNGLRTRNTLPLAGESGSQARRGSSELACK